jgi:hypothetical protein
MWVGIRQILLMTKVSVGGNEYFETGRFCRVQQIAIS